MSSLLLSTRGIVCGGGDRLNPARSAKCAACGATLLPFSEPVKPAEVRPASSAALPPAHPSAKVSPLVDSVLAAQAHARPKPPVLVARKDGPSPRSPSKSRPAPAAAPPAKAPVAREPIPANQLLKKRPARRQRRGANRLRADGRRWKWQGAAVPGSSFRMLDRAEPGEHSFSGGLIRLRPSCNVDGC